MKQFPFPSKEVAYDEIKRDVMYNKLVRSGADLNAVVDRAWNTGVNAARDFYAETGGERDFQIIARQMGLSIQKVPTDNVIAGKRYFSEYMSNQKNVILYTESIQKWADSNELAMDEAENLILAHEFFHHLESTRIGFTSKQASVPMIEIFGIKIGATGVRALSEIGAHAFARTYYELANTNQPTK
ncbi:MAG: hypothetical protein ACI4P4_13980 [Faecousia sp.]